ncbi:MAG: hypothetical protein QOJ59_5133 [Thermomicrobiales bacterium]|nr:hypothetical protein [Thermomicrobiales bacterium]
MVERAFIGDCRAAGEERRVHDIAVPDDPADVGGRPPNVRRLQSVTPLAGPLNPDLIAAMNVNGELRFGRRAGGRQDEGRFVRLHHLMRRRLPTPTGDERFPLDRSPRQCSGTFTTLQHDHMLDRRCWIIERLGDDAAQRDLTPLAQCEIRRQEDPRLRQPQPLGERPAAEASKDDQVDRADPRRRQHRHDRFGHRRHVDPDAIASLDAETAQRRRDLLHSVEELGVGVDPLLATLVERDQRGMSAPAVRDMEVQAVVAEIGETALEPTKRRRRPIEDPIPGPEPMCALRSPRPEAVRIGLGLVQPALDDRIDDIHADAPSLGPRSGPISAACKIPT